MPCERVRLPDGTVAIVRIAKPAKRKCSACKRPRTADRLCDWKIGDGKTCDAQLCANCTSSPAARKDLCPAHAAEWTERRKVLRRKLKLPGGT